MQSFRTQNQPRTVKVEWLDNVPGNRPTDEAVYERKRRRDLLYRIRTGRVKKPSLATCVAYGLVKAEDVYLGGTLDTWARPPPRVQETAVQPPAN